MIGKLIRLNRRQPRAAMRKLQKSLFALTRYIIDADPYQLIADVGHDVVSLSDYALAVEAAGIEPGEKVEAFGVRNLFGEDLADWQAQMLAVAARAPKMKSPVIHIILSLQENETWTEDQREEAISIILETLALGRCQVIWAEHSNTANAHLHLSVVRVDPITGNAAGTDWLIDDLHQALALVEERQGRAREPNALYVARGGVVYDADTDIVVRHANGRYATGWYKVLGRKHDRIPALMRPKRASMAATAENARSWSELHEAFEELGAQYDQAGSGARISMKGETAKASEVHATLSLPKLEERLGAFEPDLSRLIPRYEAYRSSFDSQLKRLRQARDEERRRLAQWVSAAIASLPPTSALEAGPLLRLQAKAADESIAEAFKIAIARWTKHRLSKKTWADAGEPLAPPEIITPCFLLPAETNGAERAWEVPPHLERSELEWATEYRLPDKTLLFTDHRVVIVVHAVDRSDSIDEALRIAAARWGAVTARGSHEQLQLIVRRAAALSIEVVDEQGMPLRPDVQTEDRSSSLLPADPAPGMGRQMPDLADDPVRRKRIQEAIDDLRRFGGLPLRRREGTEDSEKGGRSGKFEIVVSDDRFDARNRQIATHAVFDEDPMVQLFLQERRDEMLEEWRILLFNSAIEPDDMSRQNIQRCLPLVSEIRHPAFLANDDFDFQEMLREVRERMIERAKDAQRDIRSRAVSQVREHSIERDTPSLTQQSPVEGVSVGEQYDYLKGRAAQQI